MNAKASKDSNEVTAQQVKEFLKKNPNFLRENDDIVHALTPPEQDLGNGIIDFQHYMVRNLQKDSQALKSRYDVLVDFCRDNMSVQAQVHQAALRLIAARGLEQLLEVITQDLVTLFDVDVVRMAMEADTVIDTSFGEHNFSGIVFVPTGTIDAALGRKKNVLLIEDCQKKIPAGFEDVFSDCESMIESCAMLRLSMEMVDRQIMLAFGVRHKDRFHPGQGIELLHFLAQIVGHQLDRYLDDLMI